MNEAAEPIRQHSIVVETALFALESEPREKRLRGVEVIARKNGREPLPHGAAEVSLNFDHVLQLAQAVELLLGERLLLVLRVSEVFLSAS